MKSLTSPFCMAALVFAAALNGCALRSPNTRLSGFKDPAFQAVVFKRPLICVAGEDLSMKQAAETEIARTFQGRGVQAGRCIDIFLPTRVYSSSDTVQMLASSGYDSVLFIK